MTRFIPVGTLVLVVRPGGKVEREHITTKLVKVPKDASDTVHPGMLSFAHMEYTIHVCKADIEIDRKCYRCNGKCILPAFRHVQGGVCFGCGGKGFRG